jgi:hypothetical protein
LLKPPATAGGSDKQNQAEQAGDLNLANQLARESIELAKIKREFQQKLANL